ncbi:hypothetical protein DFH09DRAFT_1370410 [Mycena vulgaris]|nr:hypothetical protein DFH09DRAFT_1370410 [Mycena vulgaris]
MVATVLQMLALAVFATQFTLASPAPALVTIPVAGPPAGTVTAVALGVDSQGRTTYVIQPNPSGTPSFKETVVAASDYVSLTASYQDASTTALAGIECSISAGSGLCVVQAGTSAAVTATLPPAAMASGVLDVVSTAAPQPTKSGSAPVKTSTFMFGAFFGLVLGAYLV